MTDTPLCVDSTSSAPDSQSGDGGSYPTSTLHFAQCDKALAVTFVRTHHSRLPRCQSSPWQYAFSASVKGQVVAVALWNNPSARCLPHHWLELRRLACSPDAPRNTCSQFLGWMIRFFKKTCPEREKVISYQDLDVHLGTIYKAAGWQIEYVSRRRTRDRSKPRVGTSRAYRSDINSTQVASSPKARWFKSLKPCA